MNSSELMEQIVKALADAVWQKVEERLNEKIKSLDLVSDLDSRIREVIDEIDFDEKIDTRIIVNDVLQEIDVESTVRDELRNTTFTVTVD